VRHLDQALQIATEAHDGQCDKLGRPFFKHCRRVALAVSGDEARTIAYLHDVVEKGSGWTLDRLKQEGFPPGILHAVDSMTRRPEEDIDHFVRRARSNLLARRVKQADLEDNLWQAERLGADRSKYLRELEAFNSNVG
jgi:(p)ppGpp synthase/HD superfamily hydrolase